MERRKRRTLSQVEKTKIKKEIKKKKYAAEVVTTVISISPLPNPGWIQLTLFKPKCAVGLSRLLLQRRRELPMFNFLQEQA